MREHNDAREIKMILLEYDFVEEVEPEVEAQVREDGKHQPHCRRMRRGRIARRWDLAVAAAPPEPRGAPSVNHYPRGRGIEGCACKEI